MKWRTFLAAAATGTMTLLFVSGCEAGWGDKATYGSCAVKSKPLENVLSGR